MVAAASSLARASAEGASSGAPRVPPAAKASRKASPPLPHEHPEEGYAPGVSSTSTPRPPSLRISERWTICPRNALRSFTACAVVMIGALAAIADWTDGLSVAAPNMREQEVEETIIAPAAKNTIARLLQNLHGYRPGGVIVQRSGGIPPGYCRGFARASCELRMPLHWRKIRFASVALHGCAGGSARETS